MSQASNRYSDPENPALLAVPFKLDLTRAALVVTDPQIDFLSPKGRHGMCSGEASSSRTRSLVCGGYS